MTAKVGKTVDTLQPTIMSNLSTAVQAAGIYTVVTLLCISLDCWLVKMIPLYIYIMLRISKVLFFNVIMLTGKLVAGQSPAYLHYDVSDGLPGNIIYCCTQDTEGFMWFGTDKGLACFDGIRFRNFGVKDGLPDPEVLYLKLDSSGRMWIFCFKQRPCYRYKGMLYTEKNDPLLAALDYSGVVTNLAEDAEGNLWLLSQERSLWKLNYNQQKVDKITTRNLSSGLIEHKGFMLSFNPNYFEKIGKDGSNDSIGITNPVLSSAFLGHAPTNEGKLLMSFTEGTFLVALNGGTSTVEKKLLPFGGRMYKDLKGNSWLCTTVTGALCFQPEDLLLEHPQYYLKNKKIAAVFEDNNNGLWFSTVGEGIFYLPHNFSSIYQEKDGLTSPNVTTLYYSERNGLLGGDDQGNIYSFTDKIKKLATIGAGGLNRCRQIHETADGKLFMVTDHGLARLENNTLTQKLTNGACKFLLIRGTEMFLGTSNNLKYFKNINDPNWQIIWGSRTTAAAGDKFNNIWVGGINGLYCSSDSFTQNWGDLFPQIKSRITAVLNENDNHLLVATPTYGLLRLTIESGKVAAVEEFNNRVPENIDNIQSISLANGKIWLATNKGVYAIDKNYNLLHYDKNNGLVEDDVNTVVVHGDTLWAGTVGGLSKITIVPQNPVDFPTYITLLRYRKENADFRHYLQDTFSTHRKLVIPATATLIEIEVAGLDYTNKGNMHFQCVIQRALPQMHLWTFDNLINWVKDQFKIRPDTTISTSGLLNFGVYTAPGRYEVAVRAINTNGNISRVPAVWTLIKLPEWYQTVWFYLFLWLIAGAIGWRVIKTSIENRRLHTAVSGLQLQAIQAQINPHFIGNSINAIQQFFYPPDPVKASNYIAIFTRLLRTTMDFSEKHFVPLADELAYNEDYLNMIHLRFGQRFRFSFSVDEDISMQTPFPTMILQPILENATIHGLSPDEVSVLEVNVNKEPDGKIRCVIIDNGIGLSKSKSVQKHFNRKHKSKGIILLQRKISTINELYHAEFSLNIFDISEVDPAQHGTQAVLTFYPDKIIHPDKTPP